MTIHARRLDRTITLERFAFGLDDFGTPVETWGPIATVRAERLENTSREFVRAYGQAEEGTAVFRIRFIDGITAADRVVFEGEALELVGIVKLGRRSGLELRTRTLQVAS